MERQPARPAALLNGRSQGDTPAIVGDRPRLRPRATDGPMPRSPQSVLSSTRTGEQCCETRSSVFAGHARFRRLSAGQRTATNKIRRTGRLATFSWPRRSRQSSVTNVTTALRKLLNHEASIESRIGSSAVGVRRAIHLARTYELGASATETAAGVQADSPPLPYLVNGTRASVLASPSRSGIMLGL